MNRHKITGNAHLITIGSFSHIIRLNVIRRRSIYLLGWCFVSIFLLVKIKCYISEKVGSIILSQIQKPTDMI